MTHLPFDLCMQLKEAGFPQRNSHWSWSQTTSRHKKRLICTRSPEYLDIYYNALCACPTLEELIEACDGQFNALTEHANHIWIAMRVGHQFDNNYYKWSDGNTPAEAVARLWLELNKPKEQEHGTKGA